MGTTAANFSYFNLELDAGVTYLSKLRPIGALNRSRQLGNSKEKYKFIFDKALPSGSSSSLFKPASLY